jgi:prevent-host-death family protein
MKIQAGEFKAKCLHIMDEVSKTHVPVIITKLGVPIAKLVPIKPEHFSIFGALQGVITVQGDIVAPSNEKWDANE